MAATKDEMKQRELYVIRQLRKGHSPKWVAAKMEEEFGIAESTATSFVYSISAELNKTKTELLADAKNYIIDQLMIVIDESIDKDDLKCRLAALKQLGDITKSVPEENKDINISFKFE